MRWKEEESHSTRVSTCCCWLCRWRKGPWTEAWRWPPESQNGPQLTASREARSSVLQSQGIAFCQHASEKGNWPCSGACRKKRPADSLVFAHWDMSGTWPTELSESKFVLFWVAKFVVVSYSRKRDPTHSSLERSGMQNCVSPNITFPLTVVSFFSVIFCPRAEVSSW